MRPKGEAAFFLAALALFAAQAARATASEGAAVLRRYPYFLPLGLLLLCLANIRVRSKILGWGIFTLSFIFAVAVLGALVISTRTAPDSSWWPYLRGLALYGALAMTGLYQLRPKEVKI